MHHFTHNAPATSGLTGVVDVAWYPLRDSNKFLDCYQPSNDLQVIMIGLVIIVFKTFLQLERNSDCEIISHYGRK